MLDPIAFDMETEEDRLIRSSVRDLAESYGEEYWRDVHNERRFPEEIWSDLGDNGWLGMTVPEEYGGAGYGMTGVLPVIEEIALTGGFSIATTMLYTPVFGGITLANDGTEEQKEEWLPRIANGDAQFAIAVTEPDAGINTTNIDTTAEKDGDEYVLNGSKIWASNIDNADRVNLLARTTPISEVDRPSQGLSVFLLDPDIDGVDYDEIEHDGWMPERTYNLYMDGARVHESQIVGEEGAALQHFFETLNAERISTAASMYTTGLFALQKASDYANSREVFGNTPIGEYQGIQHPLADAYGDLKAARLATHQAAWLFDHPEKSGDNASNVANLQAGKAGWNAVDSATAVFGGMSISSDVGLSKMSTLVRHQRIGPIPEEMLKNYIAENELDLPRSY